MNAINLTQHSFALKAKHQPEHRFRNLYHLICQPEWIEQALKDVLANPGARTAGIDGVSRKAFEEPSYRDDFVKELAKDLKSRSYQPSPARRQWIPKPKGGKRPLGICIIRDRTVQMLLKMLLEPIAESDFLECSYGFRPGRWTMDCIGICRRYIQRGSKYFWIVEGDIKGCFDQIGHRKLVSLIQERIADRQVIGKRSASGDGRYSRAERELSHSCSSRYVGCGEGGQGIPECSPKQKMPKREKSRRYVGSASSPSA